MKAAVLIVIILNFFTSAFACVQDEISFPQNKVCASLNWVSGPNLNQYNSVAVHTSETNLKLNLVPWMVMSNGHEHGSRPIIMTTVTPVDYLFEKIYFMGGMSGEWFLKLQLVNEQKVVVEEVRVKVDL